MVVLLNRIVRNRKKVFSYLVVLLLLISIPISGYFVTSERNFDRRTEAAIFNALVEDMEVFIEESPEHVPGMLKLEFPDDVSSEEIEKIIGRPRNVPEELKDTPFERFEFIEVDPKNMAEEMAKYKRYIPTKSVDLNYVASYFWQPDGTNRALPNDWNGTNHWYFNKVKLPETWKLQGCLTGSENCGGSKDIVVAVVDSGLAFNASEVQGMNIFSHTSYNRASHADREGHGTYVTGVIASTTNNASSSVGIAHNVTLLPIKVDLTDASIMAAINYAAKYADVINMSFGVPNCHLYPSGFAPLKSALDYAASQGVVLVGVSGNEGRSCMEYPASDSRVIAIGSVNSNNARSSYSNYGSGLDFVAPVGSSLSAGNATWQQTFSCVPNCTTYSSVTNFSNKYLNGTSFAAPQFAGAAALILSLNPSLNPTQVKEVLIKSVDDIGTTGKDSQTGYGLLNLENIYKHVAPPPACGDLNGINFYFETNDWPTRNFCASGTVQPANPTFPSWGSVTVWQCVSENNTAISCQASRGRPPLPMCGDLHEKELSSEIISWPSSNFCSSGFPNPASPTFPSLGATANWECTGENNESVSCWSRRQGCLVNSDCKNEPPYEVCFGGACLIGDVGNTGRITVADFIEFKKDFVTFKESGWGNILRRSDLNLDQRISMADYSVFVNSYRKFNGLD